MLDRATAAFLLAQAPVWKWKQPSKRMRLKMIVRTLSIAVVGSIIGACAGSSSSAQSDPTAENPSNGAAEPSEGDPSSAGEDDPEQSPTTVGGEPTAAPVEEYAFDEMTSVGISGADAAAVFSGVYQGTLRYEDDTAAAIEVSVTVTGESLGPQYFDVSSAVSTDGRGANGVPTLKLMVDVSIVTSDGAFDESLGSMLMVFDEQHARLDILLSASDLDGTYDVADDPNDGLSSRLRFKVSLEPEGMMSGELEAHIDATGPEDTVMVGTWAAE